MPLDPMSSLIVQGTREGWVEHRLDVARLGRVRVLVSMDQEGMGASSPSVVAIVHGDPVEGALVRVHSRCLYGEVLGSLDCDCGPQLDRALDLIAEAGEGVVVYLDQEGRGAGLEAKASGYRLAEDQQIDTFSAYSAMGLEPDSRTYGAAASVLSALGLARVSLLTNNPRKVAALEAAGLQVSRVPLIVDAPPEAQDYLQAKRDHGHLL